MKTIPIILLLFTMMCSCTHHGIQTRFYDQHQPASYGDDIYYNELVPIIFKEPYLCLTFIGKEEVSGYGGGNIGAHRFIAESKTNKMDIVEIHGGLIGPTQFELDGHVFLIMSDPSILGENDLIIWTNSEDYLSFMDPGYDPIKNQQEVDLLLQNENKYTPPSMSKVDALQILENEDPYSREALHALRMHKILEEKVNNKL